jgi:membrane-associated phospholipid phosphatase
MALLIAQSRVQSKIHTLQEVIVGAVVAMIVTGVVYWLAPGWTDSIIPWLEKVIHTV